MDLNVIAGIMDDFLSGMIHALLMWDLLRKYHFGIVNINGSEFVLVMEMQVGVLFTG